MFSMKRRWFMAYQNGLLKARGRRKGQNRFWPVAAAAGQKLAGRISLPLPLSLPAPVQCTRALERARAMLCSAHSVCALTQWSSPTVHNRCLCMNFIMFSLSSPLSLCTTWE